MQNKPRTVINTKDKILTVLKRNKISSNNSDLSCYDFGISQEDYFNAILPVLSKSNEKKTDNDILLIFGYFLYLSDFVSEIIKLSKSKSMEILHTVAGFVVCEKWESDRIIIQQGKKGNKYYIILDGSCDVIVTKAQQTRITMKSYLRYLALLIEYEDFELLNRVLRENYDTLPIEISDCGGYGKVIRVKKDEKKKKMTTSSKLKECLLNKDIKTIQAFSSKYNPDFSSLVITVDQYIRRFNDIKTIVNDNDIANDNDECLTQKDNDDMNTYDLVIYHYDKIKSLQTGSQFGNVALSDSKAIRTASIITTSSTYFGILNKKTYVFSLKKTNERLRKRLLSFILSIPVFKGYSTLLLTKYYESSFVTNKIKKGEFIIEQKALNDNIILVREGFYEATMQLSFQGIGEIIKYYYNKIKKHIQSNSNANVNDDHKQLTNDYTKMIETEARIEEMIKEFHQLNRFYFNVKAFKLWAINAPYCFGFDQLNYLNEENAMSIKCLTSTGEFLALSKGTYNTLSQNYRQVRLNENEYCNMRIMKLIKRLLIIRECSLRVFCKNSDSALDLYSDDTGMELFSTPKRSNWLPGQVNQLNEEKLKRFFSADANKRRQTLKGFHLNRHLSIGVVNPTNSLLNNNTSAIRIEKSTPTTQMKNRAYTTLSKSKLVQATSSFKQSPETSNNKNNHYTHLKISNSNNRNERFQSQMSNSTRIEKAIPYNLSDISLKDKSTMKEKYLPTHLMKSKTMFLKQLNFIYHKEQTTIKSRIPYSVSIENYKQSKEMNYIKKQTTYSIKATRDIFFRRKDKMQLTRVQSSKRILKSTEP